MTTFLAADANAHPNGGSETQPPAESSVESEHRKQQQEDEGRGKEFVGRWAVDLEASQSIAPMLRSLGLSENRIQTTANTETQQVIAIDDKENTLVSTYISELGTSKDVHVMDGNRRGERANNKSNSWKRVTTCEYRKHSRFPLKIVTELSNGAQTQDRRRVLADGNSFEQHLVFRPSLSDPHIVMKRIWVRVQKNPNEVSDLTGIEDITGEWRLEMSESGQNVKPMLKRLGLASPALSNQTIQKISIANNKLTFFNTSESGERSKASHYVNRGPYAFINKAGKTTVTECRWDLEQLYPLKIIASSPDSNGVTVDQRQLTTDDRILQKLTFTIPIQKGDKPETVVMDRIWVKVAPAQNLQSPDHNSLKALSLPPRIVEKSQARKAATALPAKVAATPAASKQLPQAIALPNDAVVAWVNFLLITMCATTVFHYSDTMYAFTGLLSLAAYQRIVLTESFKEMFPEVTAHENNWITMVALGLIVIVSLCVEERNLISAILTFLLFGYYALSHAMQRNRSPLNVHVSWIVCISFLVCFTASLRLRNDVSAVAIFSMVYGVMRWTGFFIGAPVLKIRSSPADWLRSINVLISVTVLNLLLESAVVMEALGLSEKWLQYEQLALGCGCAAFIYSLRQLDCAVLLSVVATYMLVLLLLSMQGQANATVVLCVSCVYYSLAVVVQHPGDEDASQDVGDKRLQQESRRILMHVTDVRIIANDFAEFKVCSELDGQQFEQWRRYSEFCRYRTAVRKVHLAMPGKRYLRSNLEASFLEARRIGLQRFLLLLLREQGIRSTLARPESRVFFGIKGIPT